MELHTVCWLFCISLLLPQAVNAVQKADLNPDLDYAIANHPVIKQLVSRVALLEERDKLNTEVIRDLTVQLQRCNNYLELEENETIGAKRNVDNNSSEADNKTRESGSAIKPPEKTGAKKYSKESGNNRIRQSSTYDTVAFFAKSITSDLHIGPHQNIIFEAVDTNIGNAFNSHHGIFVAPVSGTYVFFTTILSYNNAEIWAQLTLNAVPIANTYARGTDGRHDSGSQMVILTLNQGDDVSVQSIHQDENIFGSMYTTFSGFLLSSKVMEVVG